MLSQTIKNNVKQSWNMVLSIFPKSKVELTLFVSLIIFYLSYSLIIVYRTSIIDSFKYNCGDFHFNFDNLVYFYWGKYNRAVHPFVKEILQPFMFIGNNASLTSHKLKTLIFAILCSGAISLSVMLVFRYLKEVINLEQKALWLLTIFFAFFSTNLTLSFTTESYTLSALFLAFSVFFYSIHIKQNKPVHLLPSVILLYLLGGITITNFVKAIIPWLFIKGSNIYRAIRITILTLTWSITIGLLQYKYNIFEIITNNISIYTNTETYSKKVNLFQQITDFCFGTPIFFSEVYLNTSRAISSCKEGMIDVDVYMHWWQYLFITILLIAIIYSIVKNYKNKLMQLLVLLAGVDVCLHVIVGFGRGEAFIYGGHWVYTVPLFLGWLYQSLNDKYRKGFIILFSFMLVGLIINNTYQMMNFVQLAIKYFPTEV